MSNLQKFNNASKLIEVTNDPGNFLPFQKGEVRWAWTEHTVTLIDVETFRMVYSKSNKCDNIGQLDKTVNKIAEEIVESSDF